jgi:hypothetical protein
MARKDKTQQLGQDNLDKTTMAGQAGQPEQESQDRTAGTGQPWQDRYDRTSRREQHGKVSLVSLTW